MCRVPLPADARVNVEFETEGGGLALFGSGTTFHGWVDVFAGNRVGSEVVGTQAGPGDFRVTNLWAKRRGRRRRAAGR